MTRPWWSWLAAFAIALGVMALGVGVWALANRPVSLPTWPGNIEGFAFSAFQRWQSPLTDSFPSEAELADDIRLMARHARRIRTYASAESSAIPRLARHYGLEVTAGAWLDRRIENNDLEIRSLIGLARSFDNIDRAIVGNESILRSDLSAEQLIAYLDRARRALDIPVSTAEPWHVWLKYPQLAQHVDFITVHLLPYWEGIPRHEALDQVLRRVREIEVAFPDKKVVIGEVGWPSNGDRFLHARPSLADEAQFLRRFFHLARREKLDYYVMEAFDQPWKEAGEGRVGAYWGVFDADRQPKFSLTEPVQTDPDWLAKALASAALAFLPMLLFCRRFERFRLPGRVFFCVLLQLVCAVLVWSVTLPFEFYLDPFDWTMLAILFPAQFAILAILLAQGFEFTEVVWRPRWLREARPLEQHDRSEWPFVSIHLACSNEPPEMVIATLDSLAALDYPHFEVLVVDNNTGREEIWKPVEARCRELNAEVRDDAGGQAGELWERLQPRQALRMAAVPVAAEAAPTASAPGASVLADGACGEHAVAGAERFKFVHLNPWPGFKAGALNRALRETDPRAAIVGVVDADYVVEPQWLRALVGHFDESQVGIVQCPQAHRDFGGNAFRRLCNWEFEGFFRIGMHHRNERNAIIQHGTMTLIRREPLVATGGWAEWSICEDAELGLRLFQHGFEAKYVDVPMGRGLTPADFTAYKSQRFRWAFGAMQILRRHWAWLTGPGPLTPGQRYHFLTGWFSWFSDALHLVFTLLALAWSLGMLWRPDTFSLPLQLFLIPVLGFFACKAAFGLILYRVRVPCSVRDTLGAAVASMGLSHAIARGVLKGLVAREHPFLRTAKRRRLRKRPGALRAVREEALLFAALALMIVALAREFGTQWLEAQLWMAILGAQSLPYLAALICDAIAVRSGERS